ncbi:MAG: flagellar basal body rod protein FlgB [Dehalococcoidia bacterium]
MLMGLFDAAAFRTAHSALTGLSRRQEAIASNIANVDTRGYARKEVSFEDALRAQISDDAGSSGGAQGEVTMETTDARHIGGGGPEAGAAGIAGSGTRPRDVVASRNDGNTVGVDEEMTMLVDTQLRYQALSQSLGTRISTLRTVIRGQ